MHVHAYSPYCVECSHSVISVFNVTYQLKDVVQQNIISQEPLTHHGLIMSSYYLDLVRITEP
jgi:hypothetical protein